MRVYMALKRKIRQIGNSVAFAVPNEVFDFLDLEPQKIKYKMCQDETGSVFIVILDKGAMALDEKKFQKHGNVFAVIIPKPLCYMWNVGLGEGQNRELELSYDDSPLKWRLSPV